MEEWVVLREFSDYSVSSYGRLRKNTTGQLMALLVNQKGVVNVGMTKSKVQHKRSLALIVATEFVLPPPEHPNFDTPIHLDGDQRNNRADNLVWRPRWFAIRYQLQFKSPGESTKVPIVDTDTGIVYPNSWEAAKEFGLLHRDLFMSVMNRTFVYPTYQVFRFSR